MRIINLIKLQHKIACVAILSRMKNFAKNQSLNTTKSRERTPSKSIFLSRSEVCACKKFAVGQGASGVFVALAPSFPRSCSAVYASHCSSPTPQCSSHPTRYPVRRRSPRSLRSPSALGFLGYAPLYGRSPIGFTPGGWLARSLGSLAPLQSSVVRRACRHRSLASRERPARGVLLVQSLQGSKLPASFYLRCWAFSQSHFIYSFSRSVLFRRVSSSANAYSIVTASLL